MTQTELQVKLGEVIEELTDRDLSPERRANANKRAESVARVAKQMINNADVILRAEKLISEGKLKDSAIQKMI